jgi:hypothetical protein
VDVSAATVVVTVATVVADATVVVTVVTVVGVDGDGESSPEAAATIAHTTAARPTTVAAMVSRR